MKLSARMQNKLNLLIRLYRETKEEVFTVFFAASEGTERTWAMMKKLYIRLIEIAARRGGESLTKRDVLTLALRMTQKAAAGEGISFGDRISVGDAAVTRRFFEAGEKDERIALLFGAVTSEKDLITEDMRRKAGELAGRLPDGAEEILVRVAKNQCDEREILGDIEFRAERRYGKAYIGRTALWCAAGLLAGWILFRQIQTGVFMILAARYETDRQVVTIGAEDSYPTLDDIVFSEDCPNIAQSVMDAVEAGGDEKEYRVDFLYYDRAEAEKVTIDGSTVFDLYDRAYSEAAEYGRIHKLIVNAVREYYSSYEIPYLPQYRETDFVSEYEDIYSCAKAYAAGYEIWDRHPEIFGSEEAFREYIGSELFRRECSPLYALLKSEYQIKEAHGEEDRDLREQYEALLFGYFNSENGAVQFKPLSVALPQESGSRYTDLLGRFGERIALAERKAAEEHFRDRNLTPADAEYDDSAAFSAVFTGKEIRALAEDAYVTVISLSFASVPEVYPGRMDAHLAALVTAGTEKTYRVYRVDEQPWYFYTNYLLPVNLPYGLIRDIRTEHNSRNTAYEMILGFGYATRYGHAETYSRRELFSKLAEGGKCAYISAENRSYATIVPMP